MYWSNLPTCSRFAVQVWKQEFHSFPRSKTKRGLSMVLNEKLEFPVWFSIKNRIYHIIALRRNCRGNVWWKNYIMAFKLITLYCCRCIFSYRKSLKCHETSLVQFNGSNIVSILKQISSLHTRKISEGNFWQYFVIAQNTRLAHLVRVNIKEDFVCLMYNIYFPSIILIETVLNCFASTPSIVMV